MRVSRKLSVRMLMLAILGIAIGLAVIRWNDPAVRYRRTGEADAFYAVLKSQIKNGDSIDKVSRLLGVGSLVTDPKVHAYFVSYALRTPSENPQGARDTDRFSTWKTTEWNITLQFRDGHLINHQPAIYPLGAATVLSR